MSETMTDKARIVEAVRMFRVRAGLHENSSAAMLIGFAHKAGADRPYADVVRDAWHFFAANRRHAELPVDGYQIDYADPPPPLDDERPHTHMVDDEEMRDGRRTGRDLDTYLDAESGEWVTQEELHARQLRRIAGTETIAPAALNDPKPKAAVYPRTSVTVDPKLDAVTTKLIGDSARDKLERDTPPLNDPPQKKEDAPAAPDRKHEPRKKKKRSGTATATDAFDDEEVLF